MKRLVLFVEGEGDANAVPKLAKKILTKEHAWDVVFIDERPFQVGEVPNLLKKNFRAWKRWLEACHKRPELGAVLALLDGDTRPVGGKAFCAVETAKILADVARTVGAGITFSLAVVFARQEYESWLIAGASSLAGRELPNGRRVDRQATAPEGDLEENPRDAKRWLDRVIEGGYKPSRDQGSLTELVDLEAVRSRGLRSFRRLESALSQLHQAIRNDSHIASPI